ncbi:MAG: pyridoxamine 5'-phosphate oxidase [Gammaproteobacteria bacterium]
MRNIRREYGKQGLSQQDLSDDPVVQFQAWFSDVQAAEQTDPSAMVLATVDKNDRPDCRIVLLKEVIEGCFVFYTNYDSHKGEEIASHPHAALNFYWPGCVRQVRIRGCLHKVAKETSQDYFASRPFESQLAAIASRQSEVIADRKALEDKMDFLRQQYQDKEVPCPDDWGGYALKPVEFEFWQGRDNRLHDRFRYRLSADVWLIERLAP